MTGIPKLTQASLPPLLEKGESTFNFIKQYYKHYQQLFDQDNYALTNSFEFRNYLYLMVKGFEADFWIAPLLRYYDKFKTDQIVAFLKALDNKFANDWLVGITPTTRIENVNAIIQAIDDSKTVDDVLTSTSLALNKEDLATALEGNIYGKRAAKYVLLKLDLLYHGHSSKIEQPETISIEHILPQNPGLESQWAIDFTDSERGEWIDKLGNLVLISRKKNSSQGNRDYSEKRQKYFLKNIELFSNSVRVFNNYPTWKLEDLKSNHREVLAKLKLGFGIPPVTP